MVGDLEPNRTSQSNSVHGLIRTESSQIEHNRTQTMFTRSIFALSLGKFNRCSKDGFFFRLNLLSPSACVINPVKQGSEGYIQAIN